MISKIKRIYKKNEEIINYLIIGFLTTLVSLIVYYGCVYTILNPENALQLQVANILSWIAGVSFAYITNRKIVFKSKNKMILKECASFVGSRVLTLLLDMLIMLIFVTLLSMNDKIMKIISQIFVIIANYIISKFFVFKKGSEINEKK